VIFAAHSILIGSAGFELRVCFRYRMEGEVVLILASRASTSRPMPPIRDGVPVKYLSTISCFSPMASKICAPR